MRTRIAAALALGTLCLTTAAPGGAWAAGDKTGTPQTTAPQTSPGSPLAKVAFPEPPFPLSDDSTYSAFMADAAKEIGRSCGKVESYGWEFKGADADTLQARVNAVFTGTMMNFRKVGYTIDEAKDIKMPDPEMVAFTAAKEKLTLLLVWAPLPDSTMLLLCDASGKRK